MYFVHCYYIKLYNIHNYSMGDLAAALALVIWYFGAHLTISRSLGSYY